MKKPRIPKISKVEEQLLLFPITFMRRYVTLTTSQRKEQLVELSSRDVLIQQVPMLYSGYLIDDDKDFYYLGETANEVDSAVLKSIVVSMRIAEEEQGQTVDALASALDEYDFSEDKIQ